MTTKKYSELKKKFDLLEEKYKILELENADLKLKCEETDKLKDELSVMNQRFNKLTGEHIDFVKEANSNAMMHALNSSHRLTKTVKHIVNSRKNAIAGYLE